MGSKELYIEPILDANLSVVPGLSENIAEMTAQLNETTRILTNVLANQGLEAHQQAYNGSAFSALTVKHSWDIWDTNIPAIFSLSGSEYNICHSDAIGAAGNVNKTSGVDKKISGIYYALDDEEYYCPDTVSFQCWTNASTSWYMEATFYGYGTVATAKLTSTTSSSGTTPCVFTIPEEFVDQKIRTILFTVVLTGGSGSDKDMSVNCPTLADEEGNAKVLVNKRLKTVTFNSVNALTYYAQPKTGNITADVSDSVRAQTAFVTLPDIVDVGTWAVFLTNGNIDGVNLALVDNTTHDLVEPLPAATSDISSVTQTSNLALSVSMTAETQVIRSIAQRYY